MFGDLDGVKIVVTRPEVAAESLIATLTQLGANVVSLPLFAIEPLLNSKKLVQTAQALSRSDLVICISRNAADIILPYIDDPIAINWVTIGPVTAKYLLQYGASNVICSLQLPFDSDSLLLELQLKIKTLKNKCIIILTGADGNKRLAETLQDLGSQVIIVSLYKRTVPNISVKQLQTVLNTGSAIDIMIVTCVTSLVNLQALAESIGINPFGIPLLVVSYRIYLYAIERGFINVHVAKGMSSAEIVTALLSWRNNANE